MKSKEDYSPPHGDPIFTNGQWVISGSSIAVNIRLNTPLKASVFKFSELAWKDEASLAGPLGFIFPADAILAQFAIQAPTEGQLYSDFHHESVRSIVITEPPIEDSGVLAPTGEPIYRDPVTEDDNEEEESRWIRLQSPALSKEILFPSGVVIHWLDQTRAPKDRILFVCYQDFLAWWRNHSNLLDKERSKKRDPGRATDYSVITAEEAGAVAKFYADAPTKTNMWWDEAGLKWIHRDERRRHGVIFKASASTSEAALSELDETLKKLGKDAMGTFFYALAKLVNSKGVTEFLGFTEMAELHGKKRKMGEAEGDDFARRMEDQLRLSNSLELWASGSWREWTDSKGKKITVRCEGPLIRFHAPYYRHGQPPLPGQWKRPEGWLVYATPWIEMFRDDPTLLPYIGRLKSISQIQTGKVSGDWAQSMAYCIAINGRSNAQKGGRLVKISRKVLLTKYQTKPENAPDVILSGSNPNRAREYFADAMEILKGDQGKGISQVISDYKDPDDPQARGRKGWGKAWLNDSIEITLSDEFGAGPELIQQKAMEVKAKKARKGPKGSQMQS